MVDKLETDYDAEVDWLPFFLHPEIPPGGVQVTPQLRSRMGAMHDRLKQRAREEGMTIVFPDLIAYSRLALEATEYAREQGKLQPFHSIVFRQYYQEGLDIGRWEVLKAAAEEAGLDPDQMQRLTGQGKYRAIIDRHVQEAVAMGIRGVPTFILDDQHAIVGAQLYQVFQQTLEQLGLEPRHNP